MLRRLCAQPRLPLRMRFLLPCVASWFGKPLLPGSRVQAQGRLLAQSLSRFAAPRSLEKAFQPLGIFLMAFHAELHSSVGRNAASCSQLQQRHCSATR